MRTWVVTYVNKEYKRDLAVVVAPTYTMALLEFVLKYPDFEYTGILEVVGNECKS